MKAKAWRLRIKNAAIEAGTYQPFFDECIKTLSEILEKRDACEEQYIEMGGVPILVHINNHGAENFAKNPALVLWDDLNKSALAYWRDLGLTPAGLKKIDEKALQPRKKNALAEVLRDLG